MTPPLPPQQEWDWPFIAFAATTVLAVLAWLAIIVLALVRL